MTTANVGISHFTHNEQPYITVQEYKNAPTAVDIDNLVVGGNLDAQNAELANLIIRASSYMDEYFNQNLCANTETETQRVRVSNMGYLPIHPFNDPLIAVTNFQYGTDPNNLYTLSQLDQLWFEEQQFLVPVAPLSATQWSSQGPLGFYGFPPSGRTWVYCQYTYDAGYVNNAMDQAAAGDTTIVMLNPRGIRAGFDYMISDGPKSEKIVVDSSYVYGSAVVPLVTPLRYSHATGITLGNLPNAIKQACILITTAFIKARGDNSLTMGITTKPIGNQLPAQMYGGEIALAMTMVDKFRRIR
jgi:hypothetical protein